MYYIQLRNRQMNIREQVSDNRNGRSEEIIPHKRSYRSAKIYYNIQQRELGKVSNWNLQITVMEKKKSQTRMNLSLLRKTYDSEPQKKRIRKLFLYCLYQYVK